MEYVTGGQVNDLEYIKKHRIDPIDIANKIGQLYSNMIFINGFVHSDPHPGNILVRKNAKSGTEIVLLDHGLYAVSITMQLPRNMQSHCFRFQFRISPTIFAINIRNCG